MIALELPEIETYRRDLERDIIGRKIKTAEATGLKSFPGLRSKKAFGANVEGAKVATVERVALHILIRLTNEYVIVIELGENGRLRRMPSKEDRASETVGILTFTQGGDLRILDSDGSSTIQVVLDEELDPVLPDPLSTGLDLQSRPVSWVDFGRLIRSHKVPLKLLLSDPALFVGIGEIYSNEILFDSGLRHDRVSSELSTQEIRRLYRSVAGVIHDAVKHGGTSLEARPFDTLDGEPGEYSEYLAVYNKAGELSPRSREPIQKTSFKHHVVFFCNTQV